MKDAASDGGASTGGRLVLGVDASTTACKAIVWTLQGESVAEGRARLPLSMPRPLWHEQPAEAWWTAMVEAIRSMLATDESIAARVVALAIAPQRETFVPVDAEGRSLRPAIVWMDERAHDLLSEIAEAYGAERIHEETGKPLSGNLSLSKIAWLRRYEPEIFQRTARYLDVAAFLVHRLTGEYRTGWGCVDPMGLFDMRAKAWDQSLLDYLGITTDQLPDPYPPATVIGTLTAEAAEQCGLDTGLPVVAGVGDGQSGGLGVNITASGQAYLNLGTAVVSGTYADDYVADSAFRTMIGGVPGTYSLETVLLGGTYTISWFVDKFAEADAKNEAWASPEAYYDQAIAEIPIGAEGLMLVPYWNGALNPYWDAGASGLVVGWRGVHTPTHLYRAILEGIAFEQRLHTEGVEAALRQTVENYVAMGGGTRSDRWCQIVADVTGKPVYQASTPEAAALGAGILAAAGIGAFQDVRHAAAAMTHVKPMPATPDAGRHAFYTQLYDEVYRHLFPAVQRYVDRLTDLADDAPDG